MPFKPKRPCSHPGCPKLTDARFCEEHEKAEAKRYERYQRDPATRKLYGSAWRKVRKRYIAAHPLCENCLEQGQVTPAQEVHHVKPLSQGGTNDYGNIRATCTSCHSSITAREGGRWQRRLE
ncbi:MAG: HNH endonuclease [Clostridium sp.]|nr:HNH endonuclease [Clostridium sp.]